MDKISKPQMVLIDVDGTLVDSVPDLAYCVDQMMLYLEKPVWGEDAVRQWVGNGVERLVRRALVGQLYGEPEDALFAKAYPYFLEQYQNNVCERSQLYSGVLQGLDYLQQQGYALGCVTNKVERFTLPLLEKLQIKSYFSIVIAGDTVARNKPDPEPLLHACRFFNLSPNQSLMIGDSISDVKAARAAGFQIICMSDGYNHGEDIRLANPDKVIDSMAELPQIL